jgi:excinuclease ABC subunit A
MHFMGNVEVLCEECNGKRFHSDTLEITCNGKNIYDVLELSVAEAGRFFEADARIPRYLKTLEKLGLSEIGAGLLFHQFHAEAHSPIAARKLVE